MSRLVWTLLSMEDRESIFDYIEVDSLQTAKAVDDRIQEQAERLQDFSALGREGRILGTRELVIQRTPYILAYRILVEEVRILRVLHGAQEWPEDL